MKWQYKTILFEFRKDSLLGDRYIDDEETEHVLNEQGGMGWELVSVTPVQEGLLSFFKRAVAQPAKPVAAKPLATSASSAAPDAPRSSRPVIRQPPPEKQPPQEKQATRETGSSSHLGPPPATVGEIKIR